MYENAKSEFEFLLIHLTEKIDGFCRLAVFIVHFNERGRVSLSYNVDFQKFVRKERHVTTSNFRTHRKRKKQNKILNENNIKIRQRRVRREVGTIRILL